MAARRLELCYNRVNGTHQRPKTMAQENSNLIESIVIDGSHHDMVDDLLTRPTCNTISSRSQRLAH